MTAGRPDTPSIHLQVPGTCENAEEIKVTGSSRSETGTMVTIFLHQHHNLNPHGENTSLNKNIFINQLLASAEKKMNH